MQVSALRDGAEWSIVMESLARFYVPADADSTHPWYFYESELLALEQLDVPRFHTQACGSAVFCGRRSIGELLAETPVARLQQRIANLSESDLVVQVKHVQQAFAESAVRSAPPNP